MEALRAVLHFEEKADDALEVLQFLGQVDVADFVELDQDVEVPLEGRFALLYELLPDQLQDVWVLESYYFYLNVESVAYFYGFGKNQLGIYKRECRR